MRFVNTSSNKSVASHQGGPFLAQLFSLFNQIAANTLASTPLLSLHATHDTTIKPILNFFGLVLPTPPPPPSFTSPCICMRTSCDSCFISEFGQLQQRVRLAALQRHARL
jgi:hypothetical protein